MHSAALSFRRCILSFVNFNIAGETFTLESQQAQSASVCQKFKIASGGCKTHCLQQLCNGIVCKDLASECLNRGGGNSQGQQTLFQPLACPFSSASTHGPLTDPWLGLVLQPRVCVSMACLQSEPHGRVCSQLRARFAAEPSNTKAHSSLRVASFMNDEYLLVEFLIVPRPPSPGLAGGNDATVSCFKDDMNMQRDARLPAWCCFVALVCALFASYTRILSPGQRTVPSLACQAQKPQLIYFLTELMIVIPVIGNLRSHLSGFLPKFVFFSRPYQKRRTSVRNTTQLAPVARVHTAGFHGHGTGGG